MKHIKHFLCITATTAVTFFLISCDRSPSYLSFQKRGTNYYTELAQACDKLLSDAHGTVTNRILTVSPNDQTLPLVIQKLHATQIQVVRNSDESTPLGTNNGPSVWLMIGVSRPGFGITWHQNDYGNGNRPWELSSSGDGLRTVLFSTEEPVWRKVKMPGGQTK